MHFVLCVNKYYKYKYRYIYIYIRIQIIAETAKWITGNYKVDS